MLDGMVEIGVGLWEAFKLASIIDLYMVFSLSGEYVVYKNETRLSRVGRSCRWVKILAIKK